VRDLHLFYGQSHALQGVELTLERGILSLVGRNGMGKTTLCKAIMGLIKPARGSIVFARTELTGLSSSEIANLGVGYVPQGRRLWRSLTVEEHLRLSFRGERNSAWTIARVYDTFPRLAERRDHGGAQLSGGEQQMLAISRALLGNPRLLVMDEPTEGLAPVIVAQIVLGILASMIVAWFSRRREFRADAGSAKYLGTPLPMVNALRRLGGLQPGELPKAMSGFGITDKGGVMALFATHPPIEERIAALTRQP